MKLFKTVTLFSLVTLISACNFPDSDREDVSVYYNEIGSHEGGEIDLLKAGGEFRIYWNFTQRVDIRLYNDEKNEYLTIFEGYEDSSINCSIDSSYVEISCGNDKNTISSGYKNLTHMYSEIPYTLYIVFDSYDYDGYVNSSYKIMLK